MNFLYQSWHKCPLALSKAHTVRTYLTITLVIRPRLRIVEEFCLSVQFCVLLIVVSLHVWLKL